MRRIKNYIFDLDGTLCDSAEDILEALKKAYQYTQLSPPLNLTKGIIGGPIIEIVKQISRELSEDKITDIVLNFRKIYDVSKFDRTSLYKGIKELLSELKENRKSLYIATNKPPKPTYAILQKLNIKEYFEVISCFDPYSKSTSSKGGMLSSLVKDIGLVEEETVMIGDTITDMLAAKENNIRCIACTYGYENDLTRLVLESNFTVDSTTELTKLLTIVEV